MNDNDIEKMLKRTKPDTGRSPEFEADLRKRLLVELAMHPPVKKESFIFIMSKTMKLSLMGVLVIAVAAVAVLAVTLQPKGNGALALLGAGKVTQVGGNAFGSLSSLSGSAGSAGSGSVAPTAASASAASNGNTSGEAAAAPMSAMATEGSGASSGGAAASPAIMPVRPIFYTNTTYAYKGDPIAQNESQLNVLKVLPVAIPPAQADAAFGTLGFGMFDPASFAGADVTNITLSQNQSFGYTIEVDLPDGTFSIYENYSEWPQDNNATPLTASDMPATSTILGIANQFLSDHGIPTSAYGAPEVTNDYVGFAIPASAPAAVSASNAAVAMPMIPSYPDAAEVLYPLVVNGMEVYSESGQKIGMQLTVDLQNEKVSNVSNLNAEQYQSSAYDAITSSTEILALAEDSQTYPLIYNVPMTEEGSGSGAGGGGAASAGNAGNAANVGSTTVIDLGTPTMAYEQMFQYGSDGTSSQFLVPAYVFPETSAEGAGTSNIIVPLIQAFVQNNDSGSVVVPMPKPMPL
jgi:hypothetical protein